MLPLASAYMVICLCWWLIKFAAGKRWEEADILESDRPWLDSLMVVAAAIGVFLFGQAYNAGYRLSPWSGYWDYLRVTINLTIPFTPIFLILAVRKQSVKTVWLSSQALHWKLAVSLIASLFGVATYLTLAGEWYRINEILRDSFTLHSLSHAAPVFLEGVAIGFVFVRLRWITNRWLAILIPCVMFAAAHIPRFLESDQSLLGITVFVAFNTVVVAMVLSTSMRACDIIWFFLPHYFMDIAIGAFN